MVDWCIVGVLNVWQTILQCDISDHTGLSMTSLSRWPYNGNWNFVQTQSKLKFVYALPSVP